ncbi:MAG: hypothetical protein HZC36_10500 [Armatimonadetes bacterium]|nr:hypothetical protein [Armatimonadota bacterium]
MLAVTLCLAFTLAPRAFPVQDPLVDSFRHPPASAKPHTWWHWMNGNVTKEGITADLEAMKRAGIGGAQMFTVPESIPKGPVGYMSPQWREMTKWAVQEAARLGIELCIHNCAGWSSSGGPWITPENAMQVIAWSSVQVEGPKHFEEVLPMPKAPHVYAKVDYYKDIAAFAFRTPTEGEDIGSQVVRFSGSQATGVVEPSTAWPENLNTLTPENLFQSVHLGKTGVHRQDGLDPDLTPGAAGLHVPKEGFFLLTGKMDASGKLTWNVPEGNWTILRMGHVPTGKDNHPSPPEGDGLEVDKLSREALQTHWDGIMAKVLADAGPLAGKSLNNALIDSYEVGSQNWTPRMREEFQKRRGYDLMAYLPTVAGVGVESKEVTERFLWDFRRTIADMFTDNYFAAFGEMCRKAGILYSNEPYGNGGFDDLQAGGKADIPMGEFWIGGGAMETTKIASSAAHIYGKKIVGAEAFTAGEGEGRYTVEPYSIKALGDYVFTQGINRYIFHRYAMQPWMDLKPGMTMGPWGSHLDRHNTWWNLAPAWLTYVARCQSMLQQGLFVADTLYFYGDNGPNTLPSRANLNPKLPAGYDYDGCDATIIRERATVKNGRVVLPDGMSYRVLVMPETKFMTPETLRRVRQLVLDGATIVGPRPEKSPSLVNYPACDEEVAKIAAEVWGDLDGKTKTSRGYGKGTVYWGATLAEVLKTSATPPDFEFRGFGAATKLAYIHRNISGAEAYFVSNQRYSQADADCTFRVSGKLPELWHPETGEIEPAPVWREEGGRTIVSLRFQPAESVFVIFRKPISAKGPRHLVSFEREGERISAAQHKIEIRSARYGTADGRGADVTDVVRRLVQEGATEIEATNGNFGDPVVNVVKQLTIDYSVDGRTLVQTVGENQTVVLLQLPGGPKSASYTILGKSSGAALVPIKGGTYRMQYSDGTKGTLQVKSGAQDLAIGGAWDVAFAPNLGAPPKAVFPKLLSWTESDVPGIKYFSGTATYKKEFFVADKAVLGPGRKVFLDLGEVKNFAQVKLNGKPLGILWKAPFVVDVTGLIRTGSNTLEVQVTNLWPNRLIGDEQLPPDVEWQGNHLKDWPDWYKKGEPRPKTGRVAFTTWRYYHKDSKLLASGLMGPVMLRSAQRVEIR